MLVDFGAGSCRASTPSRILDLGTGTGCIAIALLGDLPRRAAVAIDISPEALRLRLGEAGPHGVTDRLDARIGSWLSRCGRGRGSTSSSPTRLISTRDNPRPGAEVREHDPHVALDGGRDGLNAYRSDRFSAARAG